MQQLRACPIVLTWHHMVIMVPVRVQETLREHESTWPSPSASGAYERLCEPLVTSEGTLGR